jgi:hypothetical protein
MDSVKLNNTIQENWTALPDSPDLWSHCGVVPLFTMYMSIAGITPTAPGFAQCRVRPQLADLESLELVVPTVRGEIGFSATGRTGSRTIRISVPDTIHATLMVDAAEKLPLKRSPHIRSTGHAYYLLPPGKTTEVLLTRG